MNQKNKSNTKASGCFLTKEQLAQSKNQKGIKQMDYAIKNMNRVSVSDRFLRILVLMLDLNMKNGSFFDESKVCHLLEHYHPPLHVFIFQLA